MNTTEKNKIIADSIGNENLPYYLFKSELKFDSNWKWLMAVVEFIENIDPARFHIEIYRNQCKIYDMPDQHVFIDIEEPTKKQAVYNACFEFFEWYNQQEK